MNLSAKLNQIEMFEACVSCKESFSTFSTRWPVKHYAIKFIDNIVKDDSKVCFDCYGIINAIGLGSQKAIINLENRRKKIQEELDGKV